ncbi:class I SAM-dependent DNA methyltransferase [Jannaschia aquimarina]|uniref:Tam_2 protein n=1 Tax=Jannaschia aquimarina TaxID=935700 RepID=A0A0D1EJA9_9RHOB|nr:methyltransferase domain-containing protein [Jannaschia aquimarina]KIT15895.1 Trans-aconitate 2-methyltransferase [Jannaschia aquimarina]SNS97239.1 hypothetical protein SAMN05421775_10473 [Jannaschia aquimarina]
MTGPNLPDGLWDKAHSEADLRRLYDEWADEYDSAMEASGAIGPRRLVALLQRLVDDRSAAIHDFGCGTGAAGVALSEAGYTNLRGSDLSSGMLDKAREREVYSDLVLAEPGTPPTFAPDTRAVMASGAICVGAAPAPVLRAVCEAMPEGCILVLSYNDDTLRHPDYMDELARVQSDGVVRMEFAEYGPQLPKLGRGATIYALRRL